MVIIRIIRGHLMILIFTLLLRTIEKLGIHPIFSFFIFLLIVFNQTAMSDVFALIQIVF